jgi:hypothetical protein
MRTTLEIAEDVLLAAKDIAARDGATMGEAISGLARKVLISEGELRPTSFRNGFPLLAVSGQVITTEFIKSLQGDES